MKKAIGLLMVAVLLLAAQCKKEPIADFSFQDNTMAKSPVYFTNHSEYDDSWYWDFGDTHTSTSRSPSHTYQKPGTYTVTLTVTGEGGDDTQSKSIHISGTTYSIKNSSSYMLYSVVSFYWDGYDILDYTEHGTLNPNQETETILTDRDEIGVAFMDSEGTIWLVYNPYSIISRSHNTLIIDDNTFIYSGEKRSEQDNDSSKVLLFEKLKAYMEKSQR